jgi:PAS domain S-box-containing protein
MPTDADSAVNDTTGHDRTEKSLASGKQRYGLIFNSGNDAMFVYSVNDDGRPGRFTEVNDVACARLEYRRDELLTMSPADIDADGMNDRKAQALKRLLATGQTVFEMIHVGKSGKRIPVEISSRSFFDGGRRYTLSIARDLTERKNTEQALRDSEYFFKESQRVASIGSYRTDFVTGYWVSSAVLDTIFGIDENYDRSVAGWLDIVHPDDRETMSRYLMELIAVRNTVFDHAYRIARKSDGALRWVHGLGKLGFDRDGTVVSMIGTIQDITERKISEGRERLALEVLGLLNHKEISMDSIHEIILRIKEYSGIEAIGIRLQEGGDYPYYETTGFPGPFIEKERSLCERDGLGAVIRDCDGNPVLECMCGNVLCGRINPAMPFFTAGGSFWSNNTTKLLASTTEEDRLARTRNRCNGEGYESVALIPIRSENAIIGLLQLNDHRPDRFTPDFITFFEGLAVSIGIAVFRKNAAAIRLQFIEQSRQTQKLEALGVLAGGIAHDFNNLMGGVFGYIDLARETSRDELTVRNLTKAIATIHRVQALTGQLLTFSKGGAPVQKIGPVFPFVEDAVRFILSGSAVACRFDVSQNLRQCNFDENQMGQVIDNLVINAQQAMPLGGTIDVAAENTVIDGNNHPVLKDGNYVRISIRDCGIGIPAEILPRIFDPFFTTKAKGHGLGLATCFSIMKRHGGTIDVESEPGKGTTFHLYLPASNETVAAEKTGVASRHTGSGRFIVVDDEPVIRETTGDMLTLFGYSVILKAEGNDALDFFAAETRHHRPIAGILFDLTIPGGRGGRETISDIRKLDPSVPVFAVSGYADDPVIAFPGKYGFTDSLCKPFKIADLAEKLNKHLSGALPHRAG